MRALDIKQKKGDCWDSNAAPSGIKKAMFLCVGWSSLGIGDIAVLKLLSHSTDNSPATPSDVDAVISTPETFWIWLLDD